MEDFLMILDEEVAPLDSLLELGMEAGEGHCGVAWHLLEAVVENVKRRVRAQ
ncbi:hypothetical protein [Fundidesulfovibrio putealis]|uniref:hypothetical protein n=1 Tax=Fundidesulfovibrio putealis TaxID=270496 RepID=UPI0003F77244|nr:hypothetical protein [Fundidesulfovibrio putealis]